MTHVFVVTQFEADTPSLSVVRGVYASKEAALAATVEELYAQVEPDDGDELFNIDAAKIEGFPFKALGDEFLLSHHILEG